MTDVFLWIAVYLSLALTALAVIIGCSLILVIVRNPPKKEDQGMTRFRTWLADLVTGGEYSRFQDGAERTDYAEKVADYWMDEAKKYGKALDDIAAMETPNANATVRRMARRARRAREARG